MLMRIKLYGALSQQYPDYRHSQGIEVEITEGTMVRDPLACLEISESQGAVVAMEGRIIKADNKIRSGVSVHVLQAIHGG